MRARGGELWRISDLHPTYDPFHFVLFHPHGELGWQPSMPHATIAPDRPRAVSGEEEGDAGHVAADVEPAQPAQDDGSKEEGDVEHVAADAGPAQPAQSKKSLHGSGLAITCKIGTWHCTPSLCMANVCINSGLLTNIAKWNHNGCFTYVTTKALCVLQFMVAWLMQLPITTPTSTTWASS